MKELCKKINDCRWVEQFVPGAKFEEYFDIIEEFFYCSDVEETIKKIPVYTCGY